MELWRISNHRTLDGAGGLRASARWHTRGRRIVYLAQSPAGALLEVLVHLDFDEAIGLPARYTLLKMEASARLPVETLADLQGSIWKGALGASRRLGDRWLRSGSSPLARVPSSIVPHTWNYLLNPVHPAAEQLRITDTLVAEFDSRLMGLR